MRPPRRRLRLSFRAMAKALLSAPTFLQLGFNAKVRQWLVPDSHVKQRRRYCAQRSDGVSAFPPAMTKETSTSIPAARNARVMHRSRPSQRRGHRECRCNERTRSLACTLEKHASKSPQVRRNIRHSLRDWFDGLYVLSSVYRAF